jgi:hypothetical protein
LAEEQEDSTVSKGATNTLVLAHPLDMRLMFGVHTLGRYVSNKLFLQFKFSEGPLSRTFISIVLRGANTLSKCGVTGG